MVESDLARIWEDLAASLQSEAIHTSMRREALHTALRYTARRIDWLTADIHERTDADGRRSAAHDAWIAVCNSLSRRMADLGLSTEWRRLLGDATTPEGRRNIGDFAAYVTYRAALLAR